MLAEALGRRLNEDVLMQRVKRLELVAPAVGNVMGREFGRGDVDRLLYRTCQF